MGDEIAKALIGAVGAFGGAMFAGWVMSQTTRKTLFVNTVTKERAEWRADLRAAVGDLVKRVELALNDETRSLAEVHESRVAVRLRLNPSDAAAHVLDRLILEALEKLPGQLRPASGVIDRAKVKGTVARIECCAQRLLKKEWDKSKNEARTGDLAP